MVTVAHALVHGGIRGTGSNLLFSLYVGQDWLSPATLSMGGALRGTGSGPALRSRNQLRSPSPPFFSVNFPRLHSVCRDIGSSPPHCETFQTNRNRLRNRERSPRVAITIDKTRECEDGHSEKM